jgi:hypothetical protein
MQCDRFKSGCLALQQHPEAIEEVGGGEASSKLEERDGEHDETAVEAAMANLLGA